MDESERFGAANKPDAAGQATITARAKINLTLRVHGRRADGYHEIESIVAFADIGDRVTMCWRAGGSGPQPATLEVTGPFALEIAGENLALTAIRRVEAAAGGGINAAFLLDKQLPIASGIGGGSADAAAVLALMAASSDDLAKMIRAEGFAAKLGADVPVCLAGQSAVMTGIGERLRPLVLPRLDIVLVNPLMPVPADKTRRVFQALAAGPLEGPSETGCFESLDRERLIETMRRIGNDLEAPAGSALPWIDAVKVEVSATTGCEIAFLSGAGPTIVGLYRSAEAARAAERALGELHPGWWVRAGCLGEA